jgi:hypothetical protein
MITDCYLRPAVIMQVRPPGSPLGFRPAVIMQSRPPGSPLGFTPAVIMQVRPRVPRWVSDPR